MGALAAGHYVGRLGSTDDSVNAADGSWFMSCCNVRQYSTFI